MDEGTRLGWAAGTVRLYPPANAQMAHDDVQTNGGVLVAGGGNAASALQAITPPRDNIPIIVAYAGEVLSNHASNMTGFIGDCVTVAENHLRQLKAQGYNGQHVTVLLDANQDNTVTQNILGRLLKIDRNINRMPITLVNTQQLTAAQLTTGGFMMISNAVFFRYANVIGPAVDQSNVQMAHYPEFEYRRHHHQHIGKAHVSGYDVPLTYRLAASWVNDLLSGYWTLGPCPKNLRRLFRPLMRCGQILAGLASVGAEIAANQGTE